MKKRIVVATLAFVVMVLTAFGFASFGVDAAEKKETLSPYRYEVRKGSSFSFSSDKKISSFAYGRGSLGSLFIKGSINEASEYEEVMAYGTSGNVTFGYDYSDAYHSNNKDEWNLFSSDWFESKITVEGEDIKTSKNIDNGALIIQKSSNGKDWENVVSISDFFNTKTTGREALYTTTEEELKVGTYYRVTVVYTMQKRTKAGGFAGVGEEYDKRSFAEVYEVFLCSDNNYCEVYDMTDRVLLNLPVTVNDGFYIKKNGSSASIKLFHENGAYWVPAENSTYSNPGNYTLTIITKLKKAYSYRITVKNGVNMKQLNAATYDCGENKGYKPENKINGSAQCCNGNHFDLHLGHSSQQSIVRSSINGIDSYGVQGDKVAFYVSLNPFRSGWTGAYDSWGKKENEYVDGVRTGEVGTGALILQKSKDGREWKNIDAGGYASGLYTTDFETHYGTTGKVEIYTPAGDDILKGMYYRILYAYEVKKDKTVKNYLEEYVFYLCSSSTEAVTFHNETVADTLNESFSELDNSTAEIYRSAETLTSGSCTTTGFRTDKSLNPLAKITVKKNGKWFSDDPVEVTETGRYDITITTAVGNSSTVTIYVDRESEEDIYKRYFGESFIDGVRVFGTGQYPIFEGGQRTKYKISKASDTFLPVYGTITNKTTKSVIKIDATREAKSGALTEAGEYEAVFYTNPTFAKDDKAGDNRVFTFRFTVIEEGTAPGPVINKERLYEYSKSSLADAYPVYYGLTYQSAARGNITLAFATEKAAVDFAYKYETGDAEAVGDGTFNYKGTTSVENGEYKYNGSFVKQKENYSDGWTLSDAIYNYAKQSVQRSYFDYGTLYTIKDEVISVTENLRQLELDHSIVVFANDIEKQLLTSLDTLPFICDKQYLYVNKTGKEQGFTDFEFTSDIYGADSYEVFITDINGKEYKIEYNKSVGAQLEKAGCPSGIVTIVEKTKWGQVCEPYQAIYVANGENTGKVKLQFSIDGGNQYKEYTFSDCSEVVKCDGFSITNISDDLDPYGLITVTDAKGNVSFFAADEKIEDKWVLEGPYTITYKNRLGYGFSFQVTVNENNNAVIVFEGAESEGLSAISTRVGDKNVGLPILTRYGYDFAGYADKNGNIYENEIASIQVSGQMILSSVWKPKKFALTTIINGTEQSNEISYGQLVEIPAPQVPDGFEFVGWTMDGEDYNENTIKLTKEENIILIAKLKKAANTPTPIITEHANDDNGSGTSEYASDSENKQNEVTETKTNTGLIVVIVIVVLCVLAGGGVLWYVKSGNNKGIKNDSEVK